MSRERLVSKPFKIWDMTGSLQFQVILKLCSFFLVKILLGMIFLSSGVK